MPGVNLDYLSGVRKLCLLVSCEACQEEAEAGDAAIIWRGLNIIFQQMKCLCMGDFQKSCTSQYEVGNK